MLTKFAPRGREPAVAKQEALDQQDRPDHGPPPAQGPPGGPARQDPAEQVGPRPGTGRAGNVTHLRRGRRTPPLTPSGNRRPVRGAAPGAGGPPKRQGPPPRSRRSRRPSSGRGTGRRGMCIVPGLGFRAGPGGRPSRVIVPDRYRLSSKTSYRRTQSAPPPGEGRGPGAIDRL